MLTQNIGWMNANALPENQTLYPSLDQGLLKRLALDHVLQNWTNLHADCRVVMFKTHETQHSPLLHTGCPGQAVSFAAD